ncbi:MAG: hypothetical protein ACRCYV_06305 [Aeromonas sp.]
MRSYEALFALCFSLPAGQAPAGDVPKTGSLTSRRVLRISYHAGATIASTVGAKSGVSAAALSGLSGHQGEKW